MIPWPNLHAMQAQSVKQNIASCYPSSIIARHGHSSSVYCWKSLIYRAQHDSIIALIMDNFRTKSVKELQQYLKNRGVVFTGYYKANLVELCNSAALIGLQIDPDGLVEDREEVVLSKLRLEQSLLPLPSLLDYYSNNIAIVPQVNIFDIYNYLVTFRDYDHAIFRDVTKMEGYSMAKDGYVLEMKFAQYRNHNGVYAVLAKVKPRVQERDPLTKMKYYTAWIVLKDEDDSRIHSALCMCKGG